MKDNRLGYFANQTDIPCSPGEHGQEGGENLPTAKAAKRACDCVADCAEIVVLEPSTSGICSTNSAHAHFGLRGLLLATFAKPSTNFTNSLPSFFAFVSGLWLKTDAGPRDGENKKW